MKRKMYNQLVDEALRKARSVMSTEQWAKRHLAAYTDSDMFGRPVLAMLQALGDYADAHYKRYAACIGNEGCKVDL